MAVTSPHHGDSDLSAKEIATVTFVYGTDGNDTLYASEGEEWLYGLGGDDYLEGRGGNDQLYGGPGNDVYIVTLDGNGGIDFVREHFNEGIDEVRTDASSYSIQKFNRDDIENLTGTSDSGQYLQGNHGANVIKGGAGDDYIHGWGWTSRDTLIGGKGNDRYEVGLSATIIEEADGGIDSVTTKVRYYVVPEHVENATGFQGIKGSNGTIRSGSLTGNAEDNTLDMGLGHDLLDGREGADLLRGGAGNDTYIIDDAGDVIFDQSGIDQARSTASHVLSAGVENLILLGELDINGSGNDGANKLTGNDGGNILRAFKGRDVLNGLAGNDTLSGHDGDDQLSGGVGDDLIEGGNGNDTVEGGAGSDRLYGNLGNDTVSYAHAAASVRVSLASLGLQDTIGAGQDSVRGFEALAGSRFGDWLTGDAGANLLIGNAGDDQLNGGGGNDRLDGGLGFDTAVYVDAGSGVSIDLRWSGQPRAAGTDTLTGIEAVVGSMLADRLIGNAEANRLNGAAADDVLFGLAGLDTLLGGAGNDRLDGGTEADRLVGGAGNDIYFVDDSSDVVIEFGSEGLDRVYASADFQLSANVEALKLQAGATKGIGNGLDNVIVGSAGTNDLQGGGGDDLIQGGLGGDTIRGGADQDRLYGQLGADTLHGDYGEDLLLGGAGDDILVGGVSNDVLVGGAGKDALAGGAGADRFRFLAEDVAADRDGADIVNDFSGYQGDKLDLRAIDADTAATGNNAFTFIGQGAFSQKAGELRFEAFEGNTYLMGDRDGDGLADMFIRLDGLPPLKPADLML